MDNFVEILEKAMKRGKEKYPNASEYHHAAFANSVTYLITGASGGYGGPSIREHAVSWALAGDGYNISAETNLGSLTIQYPDGRLPRAGEWDFDRACEFAAPICFGKLPSIASRILNEEHCFDSGPNDLRKRIEVFCEDNLLSFDGETLASAEEYNNGNRDVGSIFESLNPGEVILLKEGEFCLDNDLDLIQISFS